MLQGSGLICAHLLDGQGGSKLLNWEGVRAWKPGDGVLWVHLERNHTDSTAWLEHEAGIEDIVRYALQEDETRPRFTKHKHGLLLFLRGVNLAPGAEPEDMVSVRFWIEEHRVISVRIKSNRRVLAVTDVRKHLKEGTGPNNIGDLVVMVASSLFRRIEPVLNGMEEQLDTIEENILVKEMGILRHDIAHLRIRSTKLRRYIAPQREVMSGLCNVGMKWVTESHKAYFHENYEQLARYIDALDMIRERASVIQDEISNNMSERLNRNMFILSTLTALFLPLGFLTGLFGINIGGLPGVGDPYAFPIFMGLLVLITVIVLFVIKVYFFKEKKRHAMEAAEKVKHDSAIAVDEAKQSSLPYDAE